MQVAFAPSGERILDYYSMNISLNSSQVGRWVESLLIGLVTVIVQLQRRTKRMRCSHSNLRHRLKRASLLLSIETVGATPRPVHWKGINCPEQQIHRGLTSIASPSLTTSMFNQFSITRNIIAVPVELITASQISSHKKQKLPNIDSLAPDFCVLSSIIIGLLSFYTFLH